MQIAFVDALFIGVASTLAQLRAVLIALVVMIFIGGLMRLTQGDTDPLFSGAIAPSLIAELILFPLLGLWIFNTTGGHATKLSTTQCSE